MNDAYYYDDDQDLENNENENKDADADGDDLPYPESLNLRYVENRDPWSWQQAQNNWEKWMGF